MTSKNVLKMGNPQLLEVSSVVTDFNSKDLHLLIDDLIETMHEQEGVGLAAPQVGISLRIIVYGFKQNQRYPEQTSITETVLINPEITPTSSEMTDGWEGCLSVPGLRGLVSRFTNIHIHAKDQWGQPIDKNVSDFEARIIQHECDHLNGILYPMRIKDIKSFGFKEEIFNNDGKLINNNIATC